MLSPLMLIYWAVPTASHNDSLYSFVNSTAPVYFIAVMVFLAMRTLKRMPDALWTGVFWFPLQAAVFYGFGPLVEVFGNAITLYSLASHNLAVTEVELFRTHKLSTTGISFILLGFFLHLKFWRRAWAGPIGAKDSKVPIEKLGVLMVLMGAGLKYLIFLPAQWGVLDLTIAGVLTALGNVIDVGFAIVAFCGASGNRRQRRFFWLLWPIHLFFSILTLSKLVVVMAILLPLIGAFAAHRNRKKLMFWLAITALVYGSLQPFVKYGRATIYERTSTISEAGYAERFGILVDFISYGGTIAATYEDGRQSWWTRLSAAGPQAYAMKLRDQGNVILSLNQAWMYFIPRAVWPGKPILVGPGLAFYRLVSGNEDADSFLGLSIYGDLYWQYGWIGVALGSTLIGFLFAALSSQSVRAIRRRDFIMLPVVLMALQITLLGPNKYVLNGIIGPLPIYFAFYFFSGWLSRVLRSRSIDFRRTA